VSFYADLSSRLFGAVALKLILLPVSRTNLNVVVYTALFPGKTRGTSPLIAGKWTDLHIGRALSVFVALHDLGAFAKGLPRHTFGARIIHTTVVAKSLRVGGARVTLKELVPYAKSRAFGTKTDAADADRAIATVFIGQARDAYLFILVTEWLLRRAIDRKHAGDLITSIISRVISGPSRTVFRIRTAFTSAAKT
jgi:hypothetical protein